MLIERLKAFYKDFSVDDLDDLGSIYTQDVQFIDPVHEINGLLGLKRYFRNQASNLASCQFHYLSEMVGESQAFIRWEMEFSHPKINGGKTMRLPGMSEVHFSHRVFYQQDSYDLGAMVYEQLPVLGWIVRKVKKRLAAL